MIVIGITGGIGHGKTTLADIFARLEPTSLHLESSDVIAEVASALQASSTNFPNPHKLPEVQSWLTPLPAILAQVVHETVDPAALVLTPQDIGAQPALYDKLFVYLESVRQNPELLQATITALNKTHYRPLLQWLGGFMVKRVDPGIWYNELMRRANAAGATGTQLCTIGGVRFPSDAEIIRANGGYVVHIRRPLITEQDLSDPTERERAKIIPNTTIINDSGLRQLTVIAQQVLNDIKLGRLRNTYDANSAM